MKVSKAQASANREAVLNAAAAQIREKGLDGISVAEAASAAGLTHGALYRHFNSKNDLKAAAMERAFEGMLAAFAGLTPAEFLSRYLSPDHRSTPGAGCPAAATASDVWRQPEDTRLAFRDGLARFVNLTEATLAGNVVEHRHERAVTAFAAMVGAMTLARAVHNVDETASDTILHAVAAQLAQQFAADQ